MAATSLQEEAKSGDVSRRNTSEEWREKNEHGLIEEVHSAEAGFREKSWGKIRERINDAGWISRWFYPFLWRSQVAGAQSRKATREKDEMTSLRERWLITRNKGVWRAPSPSMKEKTRENKKVEERCEGWMLAKGTQLSEESQVGVMYGKKKSFSQRKQKARDEI
jgi:hypothetical protein